MTCVPLTVPAHVVPVYGISMLPSLVSLALPDADTLHVAWPDPVAVPVTLQSIPLRAKVPEPVPVT